MGPDSIPPVPYQACVYLNRNLTFIVEISLHALHDYIYNNHIHSFVLHECCEIDNYSEYLAMLDGPCATDVPRTERRICHKQSDTTLLQHGANVVANTSSERV